MPVSGPVVWLAMPAFSGAKNGMGLRVTRIRQPAQKILVAEEREPDDGCFDGCWKLANRHQRRGNQCFADGHVNFELMPQAKRLIEALPPSGKPRGR